jgi:hypothetical protein
MVSHSEVIRVVYEQLLLEKSFELRTARYADSHLVADLVTTQVPADHFQPQNRLTFALDVRMDGESKRTDSKVLTSRFGVKFSGKVLLSASYGNVGACGFQMVPKVRIHFPPPRSLSSREKLPFFIQKYPKDAHFSRILLPKGTVENGLRAGG